MGGKSVPLGQSALVVRRKGRRCYEGSSALERGACRPAKRLGAAAGLRPRTRDSLRLQLGKGFCDGRAEGFNERRAGGPASQVALAAPCSRARMPRAGAWPHLLLADRSRVGPPGGPVVAGAGTGDAKHARRVGPSIQPRSRYARVGSALLRSRRPPRLVRPASVLRRFDGGEERFKRDALLRGGSGQLRQQ